MTNEMKLWEQASVDDIAAFERRMRKKGITKPVILKSSERPAKYSLSAEWRLGLVKE
jgi:hypothetical protein